MGPVVLPERAVVQLVEQRFVQSKRLQHILGEGGDGDTIHVEVAFALPGVVGAAVCCAGCGFFASVVGS